MVQYPISALRVIDHWPSSTTALPGSGHVLDPDHLWPDLPAWPPEPRHTVTQWSQGCPWPWLLSLGWPHFTSSAQPQASLSSTAHMDRAVLVCSSLPSPSSFSGDGGKGHGWWLFACLATLAPTHISPWPGDRYGEGRARLLTDEFRAKRWQ